jgi:hypothetical protein
MEARHKRQELMSKSFFPRWPAHPDGAFSVLSITPTDKQLLFFDQR